MPYTCYERVWEDLQATLNMRAMTHTHATLFARNEPLSVETAVNKFEVAYANALGIETAVLPLQFSEPEILLSATCKGRVLKPGKDPYSEL